MRPLLLGASVVMVSMFAVSSPLASAAPGDGVADHVLGQPDFVTGSSNTGGISANSLFGPHELAVDSARKLWVADQGNSRVLEFDSPLVAGATRVYGEPDFATSSSGGPPSATTLYGPAGAAVTRTGNLWVADSGNRRILGYADPLPSTTANTVLGAPDFATPGSWSLDASSYEPWELTLDAFGRLWLADTAHNRVLEFDNPLAGGTANRVFGARGFFGGLAGAGTDMHSPTHVAVDPAGRLWVADANNNRILEYDDPLNTATPSRVIGQPDLNANGANNGGLSASSLWGPQAVAIDTAGHLWVADSANNRVLEYDTPLTSGVATRVIGQPNFTSGVANNGGIGPATLNYPLGLAIDALGTLWVADGSNNRVLGYDGFAPGLPSVGGVAELPGISRTGSSREDNAHWLIVTGTAVGLLIAAVGVTRRKALRELVDRLAPARTADK